MQRTKTSIPCLSWNMFPLITNTVPLLLIHIFLTSSLANTNMNACFGFVTSLCFVTLLSWLGDESLPFLVVECPSLMRLKKVEITWSGDLSTEGIGDSTEGSNISKSIFCTECLYGSFSYDACCNIISCSRILLTFNWRWIYCNIFGSTFQQIPSLHHSGLVDSLLTPKGFRKVKSQSWLWQDLNLEHKVSEQISWSVLSNVQLTLSILVLKKSQHVLYWS